MPRFPTKHSSPSIHIPIFCALLLLNVSISYLIETSAEPDSEELDFSQQQAKWTVGAGLAAVLLCMTLRTLLNRPFDNPGTLLIDNRFARLAPRLAVVAVSFGLPAVTSLGVGSFLGTIMGMLQFVVFWEFIVGMEKGAKLFEPKKDE